MVGWTEQSIFSVTVLIDGKLIAKNVLNTILDTLKVIHRGLQSINDDEI